MYIKYQINLYITTVYHHHDVSFHSIFNK